MVVPIRGSCLVNGGKGCGQAIASLCEARKAGGESGTHRNWKDTLEDAFKCLKENLDPDEDEFEAAAKFRRMTWTPGEPAPVMDRAFEKTPHCESYVDDILVFSLTLESHLDHLRDVFIALEGRLAATQI